MLTFLSRPWKMVTRVDQMRMERHHDSQRGDPLAMTFGDLRVVDRVVASMASLPRPGFDGSMMTRHDDSQSSDRLVVTQPVHPTPPPLFRTERQLTLTAPADRPVRAPAHAVALTTAVAVGGTGSVHRRTGMRAARTLPGDRHRPGSPPATDCRRDPPPALPAIQTGCFADHRPVWGCDAGADVRRAVGVCMMGRARESHRPSSIWQGTLCLKKEVKMILKEPHARAA